jgi:hypothetical protein
MEEVYPDNMKLQNVRSSNLRGPIWTSLLYFATIIPDSIPPSRISLAMCGGVLGFTVILDFFKAIRTPASLID